MLGMYDKCIAFFFFYVSLYFFRMISVFILISLVIKVIFYVIVKLSGMSFHVSQSYPSCTNQVHNFVKYLNETLQLIFNLSSITLAVY